MGKAAAAPLAAVFGPGAGAAELTVSAAMAALIEAAAMRTAQEIFFISMLNIGPAFGDEETNFFFFCFLFLLI